MSWHRVWPATLLTFVLMILSVATHSADCSAYLSEAMRLNGEVQAVIAKALEKRLDVSGPNCKFRSEEWSVRQEKHLAWCEGKDSVTIEQRLATMMTALNACGAELTVERRSNTAPKPTTASRDQILHFDQLAVGPLPADAFRSEGVSIRAGNGIPGIFTAEPNMVLPPGRKQVLLLGGSVVTSLTLSFATPVSSFSLLRIGTAGGASVPTWRADAFDGANKLVGSVGETHGLPATVQQFSIGGEGIVRVVLATDNRFGEGTWATWNSLPVVEFEVRW